MISNIISGIVGGIIVYLFMRWGTLTKEYFDVVKDFTPEFEHTSNKTKPNV